MIGHLQGEVLFSDGNELVVLTNSGIGYQVYFGNVLVESSHVSIFISHVIKEASEELYGFKTLRDKKTFEMLIKVKGVGPKSAYALLSSLGSEQIINAILLDGKKVLTKAPGIGNKAASQIILDLADKIHTVKMYSNKLLKFRELQKDSTPMIEQETNRSMFESDSNSEELSEAHDQSIFTDTLMACKELGFGESQVIPLVQKIMNENHISKAEQLVHLVLKEV